MAQDPLSALDGVVRLFARADRLPVTDALVDAVVHGASGVELDVRLTADGVAVSAPGPSVGPPLRRQKIASMTSIELPAAVEPVHEVIAALTAVVEPPTPLEVSIDAHDPGAVEPLVAAVRSARLLPEEHLWIAHPDLDQLTEWRRSTSARLVLAANGARVRGGAERLVATLRERGIDGLKLPHEEWSGGLVALVHRFDRYGLATGAVHERELAKLVRAGLDALSTSHVARMVAVADQFFPER